MNKYIIPMKGYPIIIIIIIRLYICPSDLKGEWRSCYCNALIDRSHIAEIFYALK